MVEKQLSSEQIDFAVSRILQSEEFRRSPVLSQLLAYLAEMTSRGGALKSQTIAIEGLGKPYDDRGEADTYARVTVTRLRKALANYCARYPEAPCVLIDPGTYALKLMPVDNGTGPQTFDERRAPSPRRPLRAPSLFWMLVGGAVAIAAMLVAAFVLSWNSAPPTWPAANFPTIAVRLANGNVRDSKFAEQLESERKALAAALHDYVGLRVIEGPSVRADYEVKVFHSDEGKGAADSVTLVETATGTLVWPGLIGALAGENEADRASAIAAAIASPGGALASYARRRGYDVNTSFGCWLRFTEGVQTYNTLGDGILADCAQRWYAARPDSATAAFLYAWSLTDRSVREFISFRKAAELQQALDVLHRSQTLNPEAPMLNIAEMRAYSFSGDREGVRRAAHDALQKARTNRLAAGMAASGLALWNDPDGERLLTAMQNGGGVAYPWEHVGLFIAAMMHDDIAGAAAQQELLDRYNTGQPLLLMLKAAFAARTGQRAVADAALAQLRARQVIPVSTTNEIAARLPVAPEVRARMLDWLRRGA